MTYFDRNNHDNNIASWNCNGKLSSCINFISKINTTHHIIHLSETKHNKFTKFLIPRGFRCLSRPGIRKANVDRGGNIVFVNEFIYKCIKSTRYFEWGIVLNFGGFFIIFVYFVPEDSRYYDGESFSEFFNVLHNGSGRIGFVIGDLSDKFNRDYDNNVDVSSNAQGSLFASIYQEGGFYPINHLNLGNKVFTGSYTFEKADAHSQIDFLFTNDHRKVKDFKILKEGLQHSDHKVLQCALEIDLSLPTKLLLAWSRDTNTIGSNKKEKLFRANFDVDINTLHTEVNGELANFTASVLSGTIETKNVINDLNVVLQKCYNNSRTTNNNSQKLELEWEDLDGKALWDRIDWTGKYSSTKNYDKPDDEDTFKYFQSLYSPTDEPPVEDLEIDVDRYMPVTDDAITPKEIEEAFDSQMKGYNFTQSALLPIRNSLLGIMLIIFNLIFFATKPVCWAASMLFPIPKKGDLTLSNNWRGIQLGEYFGAWYDRIIGNRIRRWMCIDEFQTAYQKFKDCNTQIFTVRVVLALAKSKKKPLYIAFLDLEKAFDKVRRTTMIKTLLAAGIGSTMAKAIQNMYSNTKVHLHGVGQFITTSGIKQGASSSVYIFISFINGLFKHLRNKFPPNIILGIIHNLIHADDTILLDTTLEVFRDKISTTYHFFAGINQKLNLGKTKYMRVATGKSIVPDETLEFDNIQVLQVQQEKYLGHWITSDSNVKNSILLDLHERSAQVLVKYRNFINNQKTAPLKIKLKVLQACFTLCILSNCEVWGPSIPAKVFSLYNKGLKLALRVRNSTPTAVVYMETRQPYIKALILKRQLKFWRKLNSHAGPELLNLLDRAKSTAYIKHYKLLDSTYDDENSLYNEVNDEYYRVLWQEITTATPAQSKLHLYHTIYNTDTIPQNSLSLDCFSKFQQVLTTYLTSSHHLESETAKWNRVQRGEGLCKQCKNGEEESLDHFLFECTHFASTRDKLNSYPENVHEFFKWEFGAITLFQMHLDRV